jgi:hypothetical protein
MGCLASGRYPKKCETAWAIEEWAGEKVSAFAGFEDCPVSESQPPDHTMADKAPAASSPSFHLCVPINDLRTPPPKGYIRGAQSSGYRAHALANNPSPHSRLNAILNWIRAAAGEAYSKSAKKVQSSLETIAVAVSGFVVGEGSTMPCKSLTRRSATLSRWERDARVRLWHLLSRGLHFN